MKWDQLQSNVNRFWYKKLWLSKKRKPRQIVDLSGFV